MSKNQPNLAGLVTPKGSAGPTKAIPQRDAVEEALQPMNFKVPSSFHREFKLYAAEHSMKMNQVLFEAFEALKKHRP